MKTVRFLLASALATSMLIAGCKSSPPSGSYDSGGKAGSSANCAEPENPYDEGSGHYAGFEWAQENDPGFCDGNSQSFTEGCEEFQRQQAKYDNCEGGNQN